MAQHQPARVQHQAPDSLLGERAVELEVAVLVIAQDGMTGVRQVHADLVRAPGQQAQLEQAEVVARRQGPRPGDRLLAVRAHAHPAFAARGDMLVQRLAQFPRAAPPSPRHHRDVGLFHLPFAQHPVQLEQRAALLRDDQQPRGVPVQPMRELEELGLGPRRAQGLDRAVAEAAAAVNGDAGGLVDDQQRRVLVHHRQLEGARRGAGSPGGQPERRHPDPVARPQAVFGPDAPAVDPHLAAAQHPVDVALGHPFQAPQQEVVDALRGAFLADLQQSRPSLA